ncbi:MAG TPA: hypothetical protein VMH85_09190 [Terriglobales bacterium]|nr:hypothetical protein [Terriglobales bacterium]
MKLSKKCEEWRQVLAQARRRHRAARNASERSKWLATVNYARRRFREELAACKVCIGCQRRAVMKNCIRCRECLKRHREQNTRP